MKKISILVLSLATTITFSQNNQGIITYVENLDMTSSIEEANKSLDSVKKSNPEQAAAMNGMNTKMEEFMKSFEKTTTHLIFQNNITIYTEKPAELTESEINQESNFLMAFKPKADIVYYNKEKDKKYIQKDFMGQPFLVKDTIETSKWKIEMEQKMILGYPCMKAVKEDSIYKYEVWFTSKIPVSSGPKGLNGLPGMILEAKLIKQKNKAKKPSIMDKYVLDVLITAQTIEIQDVSNKMVKEPNKGKIVSSEAEYYKIIMEKVLEMQKGGGFNMNMKQ